jgi:hypothetical protein
MKRLLRFCLTVLLFFGWLQGSALAARKPSFEALYSNLLGDSTKIGVVACANPYTAYSFPPEQKAGNPNFPYEALLTDRNFSVSLTEPTAFTGAKVRSLKNLAIKLVNFGQVQTVKTAPYRPVYPGTNQLNPGTEAIVTWALGPSPKEGTVVELSGMVEIEGAAIAATLTDKNGKKIIQIQCPEEYPPYGQPRQSIPRIYSIPT